MLMIHGIRIGINVSLSIRLIILYYQELKKQVTDLIFSAFVRNLDTSWILELDTCCVKDSELYLWNFMLANKFLPFGEFEPGTFGSALSN